MKVCYRFFADIKFDTFMLMPNAKCVSKKDSNLAS